jgi:rhodanese-related sulfurtransferase
MSILNFLKNSDVNQGVQEYKDTDGAMLLDVRSIEEYNSGHIPESTNVPLQDILEIDNLVFDKDTPIFAYCHSGMRSEQAACMLKEMGYTNVKNIGGITSYMGKVEF